MNGAKVFLVLIAGTALISHSVFASNVTGRVSLTVSSVEVATKGFPCIIKLSVSGPGLLPKASIYDDLASIQLRFTSVTGRQVYVIASSKGMDIAVTSQNGERRDDLAGRMWQTPVKTGEQRSILLDLASLRPEFGRGLVFADMPIGEYDVAVELSGIAARANVIRMRIVEPNGEEKRFLEGVLSLGNVKRHECINWGSVIGIGVCLFRDKWELLSPATKEQTGFHFLLADLTSGKTLSSADLDTIKATTLPRFLNAEKECLLYEVQTVIGKPDQSKYDQLVCQYPDLEWRLQEVKTNGYNFIRSKKTPIDKGK